MGGLFETLIEVNFGQYIVPVPRVLNNNKQCNPIHLKIDHKTKIQGGL